MGDKFQTKKQINRYLNRLRNPEKHLERTYNTGLELLMDGCHESALECFYSVVKRREHHAAAWLSIGDCLMHRTPNAKTGAACNSYSTNLFIDNARATMNAYKKALSISPLKNDDYEKILNYYDEIVPPECERKEPDIMYFDLSKGRYFSAEFWLSKGDILKMIGQHEESKRFYYYYNFHEQCYFDRDLKKVKKGQADNWHKEADDYINEYYYKEAIESYNNALLYDKTRIDALIGKGQCYEKLNDLEEALQCFTEALTIEPDNIDALLYKGYFLLYLISVVRVNKVSKSVIEEARKEQKRCSEAALSIDSKNTNAIYLSHLTADYYESSYDGRYAKVFHRLKSRRIKDVIGKTNYLKNTCVAIYENVILDSYDKAISMEPFSEELWVNYTLAAKRVSHIRFYSIGCREILEINPKNSIALYNKGLLHLIEHDRAQEHALHCFNEVLVVDPGNFLALYLKACTELYLNRYSDAFSSFNIFIKTAPPRLGKFNERAKIHLKWVKARLREK